MKISSAIETVTLLWKKYSLHIDLMADINYTIIVSQQSYKGVMLLLRKLDDLILKIQKKYGLQFAWIKNIIIFLNDIQTKMALQKMNL